MLANILGRRARVLALASVAVMAFGGVSALASATAQGATRVCQGGGAGYTVNVPANTGSTAGADPYETAAANCTIGYHEKQGFALSLIGVVLAFTAATLILLHWRRELDVPGGGTAFGITGGDA